MKKHATTFVVPDLCCSTEETCIRKALRDVDGVEIRGINIVEHTLHVTHSCPEEEIVRRLERAGMKSRLLNEVIGNQSFWERRGELMLFAGGAASLLAGLIILLVNGDGTPANIFLLLSIGLSGWKIFLKSVKAVRTFSLDMNVLMTVATAGAVAIGKWEEGAVVVVLFALAEMFERSSLKRSRNAIHSLLTQTPRVASVVRESQIQTLDVKLIMVGDRVIVKPGEQIPLDGIIVAGKSMVNQAPITGESIPVIKNNSDDVYAGSYNGDGILEIRVTKPHSDTMLARMVHLVEEAQGARSPIHTLVDRFAKTYTPAVFGLACLVALIPPVMFQQPFAVWFYRSLVLLVVACPCALVLSTPVTIMSGLANAARHGILMKGGKTLEVLGGIHAVAFDKTGTLTVGKPHVTDVIALNSVGQDDLLLIASRLTRHSSHHLGVAIQQAAPPEEQNSSSGSVGDFASITGKGVTGTIDSKRYIIGSHRFIEEHGLCSGDVERHLEVLERQGKTTVILATEDEAIGILGIADSIRSGAGAIGARLRAMGIRKTILLTGDNESTARRIAAEAQIEEIHSRVLPHEKVEHVEALKKQFGTVAMVGDGINDAPALATATVGIAMGVTGSGISLETADVVLMSDDVKKIPYAISLSRRVVRIIRQNIILALLLKITVLVLGITGTATLWMAIIADDGATLAVILNGLRALRTIPEQKEKNY